jgi:hypothetical protein
MSVYAVNSKEPIAAWIPSLDTAGNGTTTLTDLVGTTGNGTLTNFALTGSTSNWVADTDAGGVRAIACDGSNDYVAIPTVFQASVKSFSFWVKGAAQFDARVFAGGNSGTGTTVYGLGSGNGDMSKLRAFVRSDAGGGMINAESTITVFDNTWHHVVWIDNAGTVALYVDGVLDGTSFSYTPATLTANVGAIAALLRTSLGFHFVGRFDDIRAFHTTALDAADVSYLYNSGAGRGRVASPVSSRRRRQSVSGGVL